MNGRRYHALTWVTLGLWAALGCTTSLELGERRYREGDRLAALETWREIRPDHFSHKAAQQRIAEVQDEFQRLVVRYHKRGAYYEKRDRLGESVLNYRLGLKLQPDDRGALDHVQKLVRILDLRREELQQTFLTRFEAGDLAGAAETLSQLRTLDPFSAELATAARRLDGARGGLIARLLARGRRGFTSGDHRSAETAFRGVLNLDSENESALGYLSYIEKIRGEDQRESGSEVTAVGGPEPASIDATEPEIRAEGFFQNALAAERAGDLYAAIRYDLTALRASSKHPRVRGHLGRIRRQLEPQLPDLLKSGREHYQQEDLQAALDQWRKVLLIEPGNEQAQEYTAQAEKLLENLERLRSEPILGSRGS